jgi:hypothetical protein
LPLLEAYSRVNGPPKVMRGQIFISYRREECGWLAGRLYDRLTARFGREQIFMDVGGIAPGEDFVKVIEKGVSECEILIAVIGTRWLDIRDEQDRPRLDNPEDFVRMEISAALKRDITVMPVLVDGVLIPKPIDLSDDLKPLVRRNALQISATGFDHDCGRLITAIEQVLAQNATARREREEKARLEAQNQPRIIQDRTNAKSGPHRAKALAFGAVLGIGGYVVSWALGFLQVPPTALYGEQNVWIYLAPLLGVVSCALTSLLLPVEIDNLKASKRLLAPRTVTVLAALIILAVLYDKQRAAWTLRFDHKEVLAGDQYTPDAPGYSKAGKDPVKIFKDFGLDSELVWQPTGLRTRDYILGWLYLLLVATGGVFLSMVARFLKAWTRAPNNAAKT